VDSFYSFFFSSFIEYPRLHHKFLQDGLRQAQIIFDIILAWKPLDPDQLCLLAALIPFCGANLVSSKKAFISTNSDRLESIALGILEIGGIDTFQTYLFDNKEKGDTFFQGKLLTNWLKLNSRKSCSIEGSTVRSLFGNELSLFFCI
jgi:hypothetical protein